MNNLLRYLVSGAIGVALLFSAATAWAQPQGGVSDATGFDPLDFDYKTPPLKDSDTIHVPLAIHSPTQSSNWAGVRMQVHMLDPTEVDVDAITSPAGASVTQPFGPRSQAVQSSVTTLTAWDPALQFSGVMLQPSVNKSVFTLALHAKNTDPINNSDQDIQLKFWNINHVGIGPGGIVHLNTSDYAYGTPNWNPVTMSEFPTFSIPPGQGTWYHVPLGMGSKNFTLFTGVGSAIYATFANSAWIGIEHVPEPAGFVLLLCGAGAAGMAWIIRRRRKHRAA